MHKLKYFIKNVVIRDFSSQFFFSFIETLPHLEKIVVQISFKQNFFKNEKVLSFMVFILEFLTNQKVFFSFSKQDVSSWRLRKNQLVSIYTTLRGENMNFFYEKFLFFFFSKIKDFSFQKDSRNIVFVNINNFISFMELERESINIAKKNAIFKGLELSVIFVYKNTSTSKISTTFFITQIQSNIRLKLKMLSFFINQNFQKITIYQVFSRISNLGNNKINYVCKNLGIFKTTKWSILTDKQIQKISLWFDETFIGVNSVGSAFKKKQKDHIIYLKGLRDYRACRLSLGLPVRGQNTHSNAKTAKKLKP